MKYLLISLLFFCGFAQSQPIYPLVPTTTGTHVTRLKPSLTLFMPEVAGLARNTTDTQSVIFYNKLDSNIWYWSRAAGYRKVGTGAGGSGGVADSLSYNWDYSKILKWRNSVVYDSINLYRTNLYFQGVSTRDTATGTADQGIIVPINNPFVRQIDSIRTMTGTNPFKVYQTTGLGGGFWEVKIGDETTPDNTGTYLRTGDGFLLKRVFEGSVYPEWFGAKRDGVTNDGPAIQAAINCGIISHTGVKLNGGTYYTTSSLVFNSVDAVSNGSPFGFTFEGMGMMTQIKSNISAGVLFDFNSASDLQVTFRNIFAYDVSGTTVGLRINHMSRYGVFENFRLYGFRVGHYYVGESYAITFNNCSIRGSKREAILVDDVAMGAGQVLTEFRYNNCYLDNNGILGANGAASISVINLWNCQEFTFNACVFEGNFGGGIQIRGASQNIHVNYGRMEETLMSFGTGGHIHSIASTVRAVTFTGVQFAYDKNGTDGTKNYQCFFAGGQETIFTNCHFLEISDVHATDFFGATPLSNDVQIINPTNGNSGYYALAFPNEFLVSHINTSLLLNKHLYKFNSTNPKVPLPSVAIDSTSSFFIGANTTIHGGGTGVLLTIDDTLSFGGSATFKNAETPGFTFGIIGNNTQSLYAFNRKTNNVSFYIDTLDKANFFSTVTGASATAFNQFTTLAQVTPKMDSSRAITLFTQTSAASGKLLKSNGTNNLVASVFSDNGTDGTITGALTVQSALLIGKSGTGTGGNIRIINDAGVTKWFNGILGSAGATDMQIGYDLVNLRSNLSFNATTGAAAFGSTVSGSNGVGSTDFVNLSQLNLKLDITTAASTYAQTNTTSGRVPKFNGTTTFTNSVYSDNGTDGTVTNNFTVPGTIYGGKSGTGTGGALRLYNDGGTANWLLGHLTSTGATDLVFYNLANSIAAQTINATTGATSFISTVSGANGTASNHFVNKSQLDLKLDITTAATTYSKLLFTETTGTNYVMNNFNYTPTNGSGSVIQSLTVSGRTFQLEQNSGGGGPFRFSSTYLDNLFVNNSTSSSAFGSQHFITGDGTSSLIAFTIGGGSLKGRIGIGNTSPAAWLDIKAGTAALPAIVLRSGVSTQTTKVAGAINFNGTNVTLSDATYDYTLAKTLTNTATLDFSSTAAQTSSSLTITVTGAATGDVVAISTPTAAVNANSSFTAYVSAADTVTVVFNNYSTGAIDPASGTFRASVIKY